MRPGDLVFVRGGGIPSRLIRFGQSLHADTRPYREWTHVALCTDTTGTVIQAVFAGVTSGHVRDFPDHQIVSPPLDDNDRSRAIRFAQDHMGHEYGVLDIASLALALATGGTINITADGHYICSHLVAAALEHAGMEFPHEACRMTPADLYHALASKG